MINKKRLINTFKQLVRIDSLSLREGAVIKYLRRELKVLGIGSSLAGKVGAGETGSLIAYLPGRGKNPPCLLINAHVDTVAPGRNIKPVERNGYLYSDGKTILGADDKAGVAALLEALRTIKEKKLGHPSLRIIFTVAEEIGLTGAKALPDKVLKADYGLVVDGGDIHEIINQAPSQYSLDATVIGRSAHAGIHPEEGINAIKIAGAAIAGMKLGRIDKETTANIGLIKGGTATNIVPEEVVIRGEARSHNTGKLKRQVEQMERALFKACRQHRARLKLRVERTYKSFAVEKSHKLVVLTAAVMKSARIKYVIKKTGGGSDANIFNERGIPTIIVGVGADSVHTTKENLCLKDFVQGTENILTIILGAASWENSKKKN
jgi:tripeptide aminopeptidase